MHAADMFLRVHQNCGLECCLLVVQKKPGASTATYASSVLGR